MPDPFGTPRMSGIWLVATWMPTPVRKPMSTDADRKSPMKPRRSTRARTSSRPHTRAVSPHSATHCGEPGSSPAMPAAMRPDAMIAAVAESPPHDEELRGPEEREGEQWQQDRVEARHDRRLRDGGVSHHLGDRDGGERHARDDVSGKPRHLVAAQRDGDEECGQGHVDSLGRGSRRPSASPRRSREGPRTPGRATCALILGHRGTRAPGPRSARTLRPGGCSPQPAPSAPRRIVSWPDSGADASASKKS